MDAAAVDEDEDYNLVQPTLIQQIKKILDEYPDDGQILKELIQNAEDAGAKEVKILYDHHSYGTSNLLNSRLVKFQGPALYAFNDAMFSREDWKGILQLCQSVKEKDPMKVGRFGLGFKSVFHMTDIPSVISNDFLLIIDPQEKFLDTDDGHRKSGKGWNLKRDAQEIKTIPDQFAPYQGVFNGTEDPFANKCYHGTLFRFPLRQEPSELSDLLYSEEKVSGLFECFQKEAPLMLLFMKNLESIELYERNTDEAEARKVFQAKVADGCVEGVRKTRKYFIDKIEATNTDCEIDPVTVSYPVTIQAIANHNEELVCEFAYLVTQYYSGNKVSAELKTLMTDESLSYLPWVGVALPLAHAQHGHLFCFLPLPLEQKSLTGLPVHVNGFFALSQNRRHLKWPSADQEETDHKITDKSLVWNMCLLKEVLPIAYVELLLEVVRFQQDVSNQGDKDTVAALKQINLQNVWPDPALVDEKWKIVLAPLFQQIFAHKMFFSKVNGGTWLKLEEAVLDTLSSFCDKLTQTTVVDTLLKAGQSVVPVLPHVERAIKDFYDGSFKRVSPTFVTDVVRSQPRCHSNLSFNENLALLLFILRSEDVDDLQGLNLLPLCNKTFIKFGGSSDNPIYIDSYEHPKTLLPGKEDRFVDYTSQGAEFAKKMKEIAESGRTQVRYLDKEGVAEMLPSVLASAVHGTFNSAWFQHLWNYLGQHFKAPLELSRFDGLSLIAADNKLSNSTQLWPLKKPSRYIVRERKGESLRDGVVRLLKEFGVVVLDNLPECISDHPAVVPDFVNPPTPQGVLQALEQAYLFQEELIDNTRNAVSPEDAQALREVLCKAEISKKQTAVLQRLPIFMTLKTPGMTECRIVSILQVSEGLMSNDLPPLPIGKLFVDLLDNSSRLLAQKLGIKEVRPMDLVEDLLHGVPQAYSSSEVDNLMTYIFKRIDMYEEKAALQERLRCTPFLQVLSGPRKTPTELFDPQIAALQELFRDEGDCFPLEGTIYAEPNVLIVLRELGLRGEDAITANNIVQTARVIEAMSDAEVARCKSMALLNCINSHPQLLTQEVMSHGQPKKLHQCLNEISWVSVLKELPPTYPSQLPLRKDPTLEKPCNVKAQRYGHVIGSVKPIVNVGVNLDDKVLEHFGWNSNPYLDDVLRHLGMVVRYYSVSEKAEFLSLITKIYKYLEINESPSAIAKGLYRLGIPKWVWNGNGFSSLEDVVVENPQIDLAPYICTLQPETKEYEGLFRACGMKTWCNESALLDVLAKIQHKYENEAVENDDIKRDLQLAINILDLLKPDSGETLDKDTRSRLLIPLSSEQDTIKFAPLDDCTYCDLEWLKQGYDASDMEKDEEDTIQLIHPNVPLATAVDLEVPTLMSRMLDAEGLNFGESFGQSEPLTRRLNRLLEEYTDGFSVPKEIIQNADDAGATEVKFLYDERTNEDAMSCLIDEGMKKCQGPALWAYNDAVFSEEDFQNITKLSGGTKEEDATKIGRFGLGFNAVYNLTDVPSFVSKTSIVFFDPHTTHLGRAIADKSKPGIKVDLTKTKKMRKLANQFKPYNGIFGCDLRPDRGSIPFNGTLFRFPLRTREQAVQSEIKQLCYDKKQVIKLLQILVTGAENLLLFTQNVCKVSVYHIPREGLEFSQPEELLCIVKSGVKVLREMTIDVPLSEPARALPPKEQAFIKQCNILKASAKLMKQGSEEPRQGTGENLESSMVISMVSCVTQNGRTILAIGELPPEESYWLVTSNLVLDSVMGHPKGNGSLIPTAAVAARLRKIDNGTFVPIPLQEATNSSSMSTSKEKKGRIFCFLPLPIHSGLPVHINGSFATDSSRRHLRERTEDDKSDVGAQWNLILMDGAVCQAYLKLLSDLARLLPQFHTYEFHSLWPSA